MLVYNTNGTEYEINEPVNADDIIILNSGVKEKLLQAKRPMNSGESGYLTQTQPVVLLWFSDIHADQTSLERIMQVQSVYADYIDDVICTGDMVYRRYGDGMDFWNAVDGAENILVCMGNHDAWNPSGSSLASQSMQYSRYFEPYINNWGCVFEIGKTYYYKDYPDKKLRLIVLNCMLSGTDDSAQYTWFVSTLNSAHNNDFSVVVASHYIPAGEKIDCGYSTIDYSGWGALNTEYVEAVDSFQQNGGDFICYITGHEHIDKIQRVTNYPSQYGIEVGKANSDNLYGGDVQRTNGTRSQDLMNLIIFDTSSKAVKIIRIGANMDHYMRPKNAFSIKYSTGEILTDY